MPVPYTKPPLTFDQQLDILTDRGLNILDRPTALATLSCISYYRFSAYCLPYKDAHDRFHEGATWDQVLTLYEFDRRLRVLIIDALERVEVAIRTAITYTLAHAYGAFGHHDPGNFRPEFRHAEWLGKLEAEIMKSHETFIQHYRQKYNGYPRLPIWMESEVMSFGSLSRLFEGMNDVDQKQVGQRYGLPHLVLRSWLRSLNFIRNVCAHHSRLWNRELSVAPLMPKAKHGWNPQEIPNRKRFFAILIILRHLLDGQGLGDAWQVSVTRLIEPIAETDRFRHAMGLPGNWQTHRRWFIQQGNGR